MSREKSRKNYFLFWHSICSAIVSRWGVRTYGRLGRPGPTKEGAIPYTNLSINITTTHTIRKSITARPSLLSLLFIFYSPKELQTSLFHSYLSNFFQSFQPNRLMLFPQTVLSIPYLY